MLVRSSIMWKIEGEAFIVIISYETTAIYFQSAVINFVGHGHGGQQQAGRERSFPGAVRCG